MISEVIIIGAGASAVYAGRILQDNGISALLLEASTSLGGRVRKTKSLL